MYVLRHHLLPEALEPKLRMPSPDQKSSGEVTFTIINIKAAFVLYLWSRSDPFQEPIIAIYYDLL